MFGGHGTPGTSVIPALYEKLHYDPGDTTYTFDPEKANRLLDEAGYTRARAASARCRTAVAS